MSSPVLFSISAHRKKEKKTTACFNAKYINKVEKTRMAGERKPFWSRRERRLVQRWVIFAVRKKGCRTGSVAAYVQRVIKVKDLQFSPGPQQSLTPLGITENDLQGGRTVSLPKLPRLLRNQNQMNTHHHG